MFHGSRTKYVFSRAKVLHFSDIRNRKMHLLTHSISIILITNTIKDKLLTLQTSIFNIDCNHKILNHSIFFRYF